MTWMIEPLKGLGALRFGMTRDEVAALGLGPVTALDKAFDGSMHEFRTMNVPVCAYRDDKLIALDTSWRVTGVTFRQNNVWATEPAIMLKILEAANGGAFEGLGSVIFPSIGVNTSGFFDPVRQTYRTLAATDRDSRGLGLFQFGEFDALMSSYRKIILP